MRPYRRRRLHKRVVEAEREKGRHEGVPLLAAFPLGQVVEGASGTLPDVHRGSGVKETNEGERQDVPVVVGEASAGE